MKKDLISGLTWGGAMIALALTGTVAHKLGYIDRDTVTRVVTGSMGLWIAWYGNLIPKRFVRGAQARNARRIAAWSQVLGGLAYAGLWAFAPISTAIWAGCAVLVTSLIVTLGYCLSRRGEAKAA